MKNNKITHISSAGPFFLSLFFISFLLFWLLRIALLTNFSSYCGLLSSFLFLFFVWWGILLVLLLLIWPIRGLIVPIDALLSVFFLFRDPLFCLFLSSVGPIVCSFVVHRLFSLFWLLICRSLMSFSFSSCRSLFVFLTLIPWLVVLFFLFAIVHLCFFSLVVIHRIFRYRALRALTFILYEGAESPLILPLS